MSDGLTKRSEFEAVALETGWTVDKYVERTRFGLDGYKIIATWVRDYPAAMIVYDALGNIVESLSFLVAKWAVGETLLRWLKVAPVKQDAEALLDLIRGYARLLLMLDEDRRIPARSVGQRLLDLVEEAR